MNKTTTYTVPKGEENTFHVKIEQVRFDPASGERLSKAQVQKFDQRAWMNFEKNFDKLGYTIEVLHDPTAKPKPQRTKTK